MLTMFLLMLLLVFLLPHPLAATLSCPQLVHNEVNGSYVSQLKDRSCSSSSTHCTVVLQYNNIKWTVNQMVCSPSCVSGNTSGALGVRYMIGCCNSSSCVGPSDFFDDINVDITWPLLQRAPILTSSTIEPTGVTVATGASTDGGSSSFLACSTCSPSVSNKKFDYKPYYIFSPIIFVEIFLIFLFLILWIRKCRRVCLRVKQEQANKKQDECIFKLRNRRGTCP
ncbi:PREDICTED: uncharacterized protein LOC109580988 [Amphimedon queenslandica]|uniref:Uncharacterized protein n=1 Tax=Amphimedon queenslandica TaxID=400682 RepID=A0AAN0IZN3_AMPQE|nr:PREDICTED: uncharacterized protein LOC109580988 [Amphimedon queenslandica]|eukprot:XP_019850224.1 PREDICTED: uncharacterized protein LOC109580988 [Amphimedon queenslandica]